MINEGNVSNIEEQKNPGWVKNTMAWHIENKITENEMILALEFLISQETVRVNHIQ